MIQTSEQIDAISAALVKAQAEIENVEATGKNPAFKRDGKESRYATLGGVLDEVRLKLAKHGVCILQMPINGDGPNIGVSTRLLHSSGQWIESTLYVAPTKFDAQGAGSVITYLRRYALMAMTGIAPEDDDGNAASLGAPATGQPQRAGIVRADDVPPKPHDNGNRDGVIKQNGNGAGAPPTNLGPIQQRAETFRDEMKERFARCKVPADVDTLIKNNGKALDGVKAAAPDIYAEIMAASTNTKNEMYAGA